MEDKLELEALIKDSKKAGVNAYEVELLKQINHELAEREITIAEANEFGEMVKSAKKSALEMVL